jgi:hypothetical protein
MIRTQIRLLVLLAASFTAIALAVPAQAAAPYCGITWGSLAKESTAGLGGEITNARAGRHDCYDRLVIDLHGSAAPTTVKYVGQVTRDPSGFPVALRGGAFLQITVQAPAAHPKDNDELVNVSGFSTFRQVAQVGSFEAVTTFGLGVRARLPFRVFTLNSGGTGRVVVDVAHRW